jgi:hypothetical protein
MLPLHRLTGRPHDLRQCSRLHMGSLGANDIGAVGTRELAEALRVNRTLTKLM